MPPKRYKPEQIMTLLRQVEEVIANRKLTPQACREAGLSEQAFDGWRKEYGGLKLDQAQRLKALEQENAKLKRLVAELSLEKADPAGCGGGKLISPARRRGAVAQARAKYGISERWTCRLMRQWRGTQRDTALRRGCADDGDNRLGGSLRTLW
jgi:putative transposase